MYLLYTYWYVFILIAVVISGVFLIIKGDSKKSFFLICSGVNLIITPFSFFIGAFATDAPDSDMYDFLKGFLFVQAIPLVLLIFSILRILLISRKSNEQ
ncbi:hypothetical protein SAMN05444673_3923 [Bacillus sp. OV166]|uniref:hypothetical protein n=1 Tax=Bacillus sp. OV166 TaxID=1882763 RepID=UPI000A2AB21C|nr:hypothetical protein [Bacillus sp. OV166]SMQ80576.1 hypothetical protein SAMN05444673_3923 [Bacillus sp. OV166]